MTTAYLGDQEILKERGLEGEGQRQGVGSGFKPVVFLGVCVGCLHFLERCNLTLSSVDSL